MAAQPQQSSSSSSSSSSLFTSLSNYDVFLSFSGKDTRATFTGHLYHDLDQAGIRTFMDEEELKKGETIGPNLFKAIKESRISIPIFSESYASSKWCLNELLQMMDCRRDEGQLVLPIFFHVDPRQVRNQIEGFGDQFMELAKRFDTVTVERWKSALREAGELKGWHLTLNGNESELTQEIVRKVQSELNNAKLHVAKYLVGINHHIEHMRRLLIHSNDESKDFGIVGIHGMVGIGKSTIARAVFNQIFRSFDGSSFRENVREDAQEKGLVYLQDRLLFDVLQLDQSVSTVSRGKKMIEERLHAKKVLIVLDDVDKNEQLEALAGGPDWFGSGSRIIITTRNEHLLNVHNVYPIYRPKELDFEQSLRLFSKHAFGEDQPPEGYMGLAKDVILIAGGLPLALEVLGSFLYDKEFPTEWESALKKWKTILPDQVLNLLKISYDELDREERDIILDTACFFTGMDKEYAIDMEHAIDIWEGCGFSPRIGIKNLIHKSLIKTSNHNELRMHELLRDMGKQIVTQESPNELGKHSRLWSHKEVMTVLKDCTGTRNVKALLLKSEGKEETALEEFCFSTEAFATMSELRLLRIDNTYLVGGFEHLPSGLGWLSWKGCPLEFLPTDFPLEKLVVLDLSYSRIKQVWNGHHSKQFEKLKVLDLSNCHYLIKTPDFLRLHNLERLILEECKQLGEVHESIGHLKRLAFLNFAGCNNLKELPCSICMLKSLKNLTLSRCSIVNMLPGNLVSLESFSASH